MLNIEDIFREIIDTPATRARDVEEAGQRAANAFAFQRQRGGQTFGYGGSTLAGQIASDIPRNTENLRKTLIGLGASGLQTQGESLADELRGLDLTAPEGQQAAIQRVMQVDPAAGAALEDAYANRELNRERYQYANATRYPVGRDIYKNGTSVIYTDQSPDPIIVSNGERYSLADGTTPEKMAELMRLAEDSGPAYAGMMAASEVAARDTTGMQTSVVDVAMQAGPSLKNARLALALIDQVGDGSAGIGGSMRRMLQDFTGETLTDRQIQEGRLNRIMATVVLAQLKTVFGSQFTETEGERLADIEADISDNARLNAQLIRDAIDVTETYLKRGIAANAQLPGGGNEFIGLDLQAMLEGTDRYAVTPELVLRNMTNYDEDTPAPPGQNGPSIGDDGTFNDPALEDLFQQAVEAQNQQQGGNQ